MLAVIILGTAILIGLVIADWMAFTRNSPSALGYGVPIGRQQEMFRVTPAIFGPDLSLPLPHGVARLCPDQRAIMLLPEWKRFGLRFRTAWPLNGAVYYDNLQEHAKLGFIKRMPWSSALLTVLWFLTVAGGLIAYLVSYARAGGFTSAAGAFLGVALSGLGLLVLLFGCIVVIAAYRLENKRLMILYDELRTELSVTTTLDQVR
ncbi:MAG TPA: hypothetical protein VGJ57_06910 [Nitrospirales bacterium]|jgi:hypothetical protein